MIVKIDKSLVKDIRKINSESINNKLAKVIVEIQKADKMADISNLKKIQGTKDYYRIRMGNHRLGMIIKKGEVELIRILHRKDVYKYFP